MGVDIHVRIIYHVGEGEWKEAALYRKLYRKEKDEFEKIYAYKRRDYELFDLLSHHDLPIAPIQTYNISTDLIKEIEEAKTSYNYGFSEMNLADLKLYLINNPTVSDFDSEDENALKPNPVLDFVCAIESYLGLAAGFMAPFHPSEVRILYWFDH